MPAHTHTHASTRAHTHACTRARTHTHACTRAHTCMHTHTHACTRTHIPAHGHTHTHTHACTRMHTHRVRTSWKDSYKLQLKKCILEVDWKEWIKVYFLDVWAGHSTGNWRYVWRLAGHIILFLQSFGPGTSRKGQKRKRQLGCVITTATVSVNLSGICL